MKLFSQQLIITVCLLVTTCYSYGQQKDNSDQPGHDLKQYFFVMLTAGPQRNQDSATFAKTIAGHLANMGRLYKLGKLIVAGPFGDKGNWQGLLIFNCPTKEEVVELVKTDPGVISGVFAYDIHPWWTDKNCVFK